MKNRLVQSALKNLLIGILICFGCLAFAQSERKSPKISKANKTQQSVTKSAKSNLTKAEKYALDGQKELSSRFKKKKSSAASAGNKSTINQGGNTTNSAKKADRCQTDQAYQQRLQDPRYLEHLKFLQDRVNQNLNRGFIPCDASNTVVIPIAVHFDAAYNCSNVQCLVDATEAQINSLNADFAAANADLQLYNEIITNCGGANVASDGVCVSFCLANQNHPAGSGLSDGQPAITIGQYVGGFGSGGSGAPEWQGYLNMFVVDGLGFGVADGIPGALNGDGVTQDGSFWGGPGFPSCSSGGAVNDDTAWILGRTLTHEVGHYLGLYHTFQDGCADEPNFPYDVNDTPAQANPSGGVTASTNCGALATGCVAGEVVQMNYMDYFDDPSLVMFSNEQAIAMNTFSNSVTWANDAVDLGCSDYTETSIASCTVNAAFSPPDGADLILCADDGSPLSLTDASQLAVSWNWTFTVTGGDLVLSTLSSTMQNPTPMITGGTSGTIEATQEACDTDGICDSVTHTYTITIASGDACPNECDYTLELTDTFGDGWNGALLDIQGNGISIFGSPFGGSFTTGFSEVVTITLTDGELITFNQTNGGFPNEEGFILTDPFGTVVFDSSQGNVGAGEVLSFVAYCNPPVCDNDGVQNGFEGGVDCGGTSACPDCCGNGVQDDVEGGVDCGGDSPCPDCCGNGVQDDVEGGVDCGGGSPCATCCGNGIQDDDETGLDCGGTNCTPCPSCPDGFLEVVNETFDSCTIPAGWSVTSTDGGEADIIFTGGPTDVPGGLAPSPDFAGCIATIDDDANDAIGIGCILTDIINIGAYINTSLVFDWQNNDFGGTGDFTVEVYDGTMWVQVFIEEEDNFGSNETIDLSSYTNADFQIRFCYDDEGGFAWGAGIDNVAVCGEPNDQCPATVGASDVSGDYCDGSTIDLIADNNPNLTYDWSASAAGVVIADPTAASTTATLSSTTMCAAEPVEISAVITCNLDGVVLFDGVVSTVNIYPDPPADPADLANYVDCASGAPVAGCENAITLVDDGAGGYAVTFAHAGGPNCCPDVSGVTTDVVTDGSFEAGPGGGAWVEASTNFGTPLCNAGGCGVGSGTGPSDGNFWAWFGGVGASEVGSVCQTVTIPAGLSSLTLQFDFEASLCDSPADFMEVTLDGTQVYFVDGSSALCGVVGYAPVVIDLLAAGIADGASYDLCFSSEIFATNGAGSNFFVDNVQLLAEEPPGVDPCVGSVTCGACVEDISGSIVSADPLCDLSGIDIEITAPDGTTTTVTTSADGTFTVPGGPYPCGNYSAEITGALPTCYTDGNGPVTLDFTVDGDSDTEDGPFFVADPNIPTLSQWGLIVLALLLMTLGSLTLGFRSLAFGRIRK